MLQSAWIEVSGRGRPDIEARSLLETLKTRGVPCHTFTAKRMLRGQVPARPEVLVAGNVATVERALKRLDAMPVVDEYPASVRPFLRRRIWPSTLDAVRREIEILVPVFIKPRERAKRFTGLLLETPVDLGRLYGVSRRCPVWLSTPVRWTTEWRAYIVNGDVRAVHHYHGDSTDRPDDAFIADIHSALGDTAPAGYSIDVGRLHDGRWALVECNDGYGLGSYDADPKVYADLIVARWCELMRAR